MRFGLLAQIPQPEKLFSSMTPFNYTLPSMYFGTRKIAKNNSDFMSSVERRHWEKQGTTPDIQWETQ
jgi:hypothetical protein